jgi:hypothetical protein
MERLALTSLARFLLLLTLVDVGSPFQYEPSDQNLTHSKETPNVSKTQTFLWAMLCLGLGIVLMVIGLGIISPAFFVVAVGFGLRWGYQFLRDISLANAMPEEIGTEELPPSMTSPGSSRLFVPPPLDRSR